MRGPSISLEKYSKLSPTPHQNRLVNHKTQYKLGANVLGSSLVKEVRQWEIIGTRTWKCGELFKLSFYQSAGGLRRKKKMGLKLQPLPKHGPGGVTGGGVGRDGRGRGWAEVGCNGMTGGGEEGRGDGGDGRGRQATYTPEKKKKENQSLAPNRRATKK